MIFQRGYCSFCGRPAEECRGGLYGPARGNRPNGYAVDAICLYCLRVAFREFGEDTPGSGEVVVLRRLPAAAPGGGDAA